MEQPGLYVRDRRQRRLVLLCVGPAVVIFLVSVLLISFTDLLDGAAVGPLSWAALLAIGQFVLAVFLGHVYVSKAGAIVDERPEVTS